MIRSSLLLSLAVTFALIAGCRADGLSPDPALLDQSAPYIYSDADWADVLQAGVHEGLVDYSSLKANPVALKRYYALLSRTGPSLTTDQFSGRPAATAYWINAYNALVLLAILQHYPISTIHDLSL